VSTWIATATVLAASVVMIAIRAPRGQRSTKIEVTESRKGALERALLTLAWISFFVPFLWMTTPVFAVADYPLRPAPFAAGVLCYGFGLWLFHRSHADLGDAWSITLELRRDQRLVTSGIYRRVRHPMYLALLVFSLGQGLVLPNWIAGPSYLVAMGLLVALRLGPEERMMRARFGADYADYARRTQRLVPGVW
jgi:protein-S-isoprenylcysteine O-methyltransferase Ste14